MKRITRSGALVPILIVIVLAFFAQRIIAPPSSGDEPNYSEFIAQINDRPEDVKSVTLDGTKVKKPTVRETNRGVEVSVKTPVSGKHVVVVTGS